MPTGGSSAAEAVPTQMPRALNALPTAMRWRFMVSKFSFGRRYELSCRTRRSAGQGPAERSCPPDAPSLTGALESQDDAQQPPEGRWVIATSPPEGRQEERNQESGKGRERQASRGVARRAQQGRILRSRLRRFPRCALGACALRVTRALRRAGSAGKRSAVWQRQLAVGSGRFGREPTT